MARNASDVKQKLRKGLWSPEEDEKLLNYITRNGVGCWSSVPKLAGLQRCGKSCRLRWINYLRPDLKRGMFEQHEEDLILALHKLLGNRWAQIATQLPGRTDNEIKNYWNSCLKKKLIKQGIDPNTHEPTTTKTEAENVNPSQKPPLFLPQSSILEPSSDHHFMSKLPDFDPSLLFDLQTGHNPMGYTSNLVADDHMGGGIIECVDFSENSSSNESCNVMNNNNNNNMAVDGSIFCWEGENKLESLLQFECCDGIKSEEEQFYSENSGNFWSYNDVPGADLQVFHQT